MNALKTKHFVSRAQRDLRLTGQICSSLLFWALAHATLAQGYIIPDLNQSYSSSTSYGAGALLASQVQPQPTVVTDHSTAGGISANLGNQATMNRLASANSNATPFTIAITQQQIADLKRRLSQTRLPDQLPDTSWEYGTDRGYLEELLDYWQNEFDWKDQQEKLNQLDQYTMQVDDLKMHFIHQRSSNPAAIPLLLLHGWPGSISEFNHIVRPLTEPEQYAGEQADAFHIIAPSLPGFGFSGIPQRRDFNPEQMAHVVAKLMAQLGYERYGLAGGDWGAIINRHVANHYPERLIGLHTNFVLAAEPPQDSTAGQPTEAEIARRTGRIAFMKNEVGYQQIQGTKPQSLGYSLNDSPAGLAAWIVEKFHGWTDMPQGTEGNLDDYISKDDILTNISIYWFTQTITSSSRIYFENSQTRPQKPMGYIDVPTGAAVFPAEIYVTPKAWAEAAYDIVHWTEMPAGGHFAALEQPESYLADVRTFFRLFRQP
ncbi:MAG: pimeloyl-ACP methyl ester carboxylesterase [Pseudohongiellaceae bacterium]|jgi:pimeloyl-ACP methyl ester carboxylesterase